MYPPRFSALKANDEEVAYDADVVLKAYEALVALLANDEVPVKMPWKDPLNDPLKIALSDCNEPVINTLPVNWCVSVSWVPNFVDPVINSVDEVIYWATIVWAVNVPLTKKLSAEDAVAAYDALIVLSEKLEDNA